MLLQLLIVCRIGEGQVSALDDSQGFIMHAVGLITLDQEEDEPGLVLETLVEDMLDIRFGFIGALLLEQGHGKPLANFGVVLHYQGSPESALRIGPARKKDKTVADLCHDGGIVGA